MSLKDLSKYLGTSLLSKAVSFFAIPVYTRVFGVELYGEFSMYLAVFSLCSLLFEFGSKKMITQTWFDFKDENDRFAYYAKFFKYQFLISATTAILLALCSNQLGAFFKIRPTIFTLGVFAALLQLPIQYISVVLQFLRKSSLFSVLSFVNDGVVRIIAVGLILIPFLHHKVYIEGMVRIAIEVGLLLYLLVVSRNHFSGTTTQSFKSKAFFNTSILLTLNNLSTLMLSIGDRFVINKMLTLKDTSLYALTYDVALLLSLFINALAAYYVPKFFAHLSNQAQEEASRLINNVMYITAAATVFLSLFSYEAIYLLGGVYYLEWSYLAYINILGVLTMAFYTLFSQILFFNKKNIFLSLFTFLAACFNIGCNIVLIPYLGILAASLLSFAAYLLLLLLSMGYVQFKMPEFYRSLIHKKKVFAILFLLVTFNLLLLSLDGFAQQYYWQYLAAKLLFSMLFLYIAFRKKWYKILLSI